MYKQAQVKKRVLYSPSKMAAAVQAVQSGAMSKLRASQSFGIPRTTLLDKLSGRVPLEPTRPGPMPELTDAEERTLVNYVKLMSEIGYPLTKKELKFEVKRILDIDGRKTRFTNNLPGKGWYKAFVRRNPGVSLRTPAILGRQRASISFEMVEGWFNGLAKFLKNEVKDYESLVSNPRRLFNADESGFPLSVKSKRVLAPTGAKHVYQVLSGDKTQITVMACMNACGEYMPPLIVYPGQRFRDTALSGFPDAIYGHSVNGWMDAELFLAFVYEFGKFIDEKRIQTPVVLFVDGHSAHISLPTAEYCAQKGIVLYCLLENATHILQPCDIGLFSPMKSSWSEEVKAWQTEHLGEVLTKYHFPMVFKKTWDSVATLINSVSAFKRSGLYPLDISGVDKSKLSPSKMTLQAVPETSVASSATVQTATSGVTTSASTSSVKDHACLVTVSEVPVSSSCQGAQDTDHVASPTLPNTDHVPSPTLPSSSLSEQATQSLLEEVIEKPGPLKSISPNHPPHRHPQYVSPAFQKLKVPEPKPRKKNNTLRGKLPKALSGSVALKMLRERAEKKQQEEDAKQVRKAERIRKKEEREAEKVRRTKARQVKKMLKAKQTKSKQSDSSESDVENVAYMDDSDEGEICPGCKSSEGTPEEWIGCENCPRRWHIECTEVDAFLGKKAGDLADCTFMCYLCE